MNSTDLKNIELIEELRKSKEEISRLKQADSLIHKDEINKLNESLEKKVEDRTEELNKVLEVLEKSNQELMQLNETIAEESQKLLFLNDQLAQSEQELKEANAAKDKFFSIIAHDLKNPLQLLMSSSDLMEHYLHTGATDKLEKHITRIKVTTFKLKDLLENLLTWSRSQIGGIEFNPEFFYIHTIFEMINDFFKIEFEKKDIKLIAECSINEKIFADQNMIATIIRNLISNAIKFSNPGSQIEYGINDKGKNFEIYVRDHGVGISDNDIKKLFRIDDHHSTVGTLLEKGTGLGLIICKDFITKHKGEIQAKSKVGEGSVFSFTIPKK